MTDGTSQGLFIVVAIVIFGIFVVLAYILFEDTLSPAMANMFTEATEQSNDRLNNTNLVTLRDLKLFHMEVETVNVTEKNRNSIIFSSTGESRYGSGFQIDEKYLEPGKNYELRYDIKVLEGEVRKIGGHMNILNNTLSLDNNENTKRYHEGIEIPADNEWHTVRVRFNTSHLKVDQTGNRWIDSYGTIYEDASIYIQPNREVSDVLYYKIQVSNFKFHEVV